jgi:hypothetical protein
MKKVEGGESAAVLEELRGVMQGTPPPWLAKILGVAHSERFKYYTGAEPA